MTQVVPGRWGWNFSLNDLEFIPSGPPPAERKERGGATKDVSSSTQGAGHRVSMGGRRMGHEIQPSKSHSTVTLTDIKDVARNVLLEAEHVGEEFDALCSKAQLDSFLLPLLHYFHFFFEKMDIEANPDPSHIDVSPDVKRRLAELESRLEISMKELGRAYGGLVVGTDMEDCHHMNCGRSRVSNTYRDRNMFETLYSFAQFVVWITFKRRDLDIIRVEVNRILRSNTFNPALRRAQPEEESSSDDQPRSPAEYRRTEGKRPSKMEIVNQRSAAMVSLLPLPREEAAWLFNRTGPPNNNSAHSQEGKKKKKKEDEPAVKDMEPFPVNQNVGILGMPLKLFHLRSLALIVDDPNESINNSGSKTNFPPVRGEEEGKQTSRPATDRSAVAAGRHSAINNTAAAAMTTDRSAPADISPPDTDGD